MNFFAAQDEARRASRRLVYAYMLSTALIVAGVSTIATVAIYSFTDVGYDRSLESFFRDNWAVPALAALVTTLVIVGSSMFKTAVLSSGGAAVAAQMGGTQVSPDVQDPLRRRLHNVVEEMAIASGVPVPDVFVLEEEGGINAFAAGFSSSDAAVAVTRGALELLDRDELQGVIAHEFSHILNGDMRLNIRLMGVLFGIMVISLIGRMILRGTRFTGGSSRRGSGVAVVLVIGLGLTILGWIGMFAARIIKAGVSRQREYLADASAVQFTRQARGIADALKKIGGYGHGSHIQAKDPEEVSHMLFGTGSKLVGLFATHPPLLDRIQALDPHFEGSDFRTVDARRESRRIREEAAGISQFSAPAVAPAGADLPEVMAESVGQPDAQHVAYARQLRSTIPTALYDAAHSNDLAYLLAVALIIDPSGRNTERQLALAHSQLGNQRADIVRRFCKEIADTSTEFRLPMLEVAFPALKWRPAEELEFLIELVTRLIEVDGEVDLYEFCFYRILVSNLKRASNPAANRQRVKRKSLQLEAINLLRVLADHGHDEDDCRNAAFESGIATLGPWAREYAWESVGDHTVSVLDHSLDVLLRLNTKGKESLLRAIGATVAHDETVSQEEAALVRAVCASLDFPLPPILANT